MCCLNYSGSARLYSNNGDLLVVYSVQQRLYLLVPLWNATEFAGSSPSLERWIKSWLLECLGNVQRQATHENFWLVSAVPKYHLQCQQPCES